MPPTNEQPQSPPPSSKPENNLSTGPFKDIYDLGITIRKQVVGEDYVERSLAANSSDFSLPMQQLATEMGWGAIWTRPGLELKTRSMLNLGMLTALGRWTELGTHVRGAIRNGCTVVEVRECLLQAAAYCGLPAGLEAFRVGERVLGEMRDRGEL